MVANGVSYHLIRTPRKATLSLFTLLFRLIKPDPLLTSPRSSPRQF